MLGIERLALAIHDQSYPSLPEEEVGRGSPYSLGAAEFTHFLADSGFNAIQLGPQGKTAIDNPSPYDSSLFSKNELSISLLALARDKAWHGLLDESQIASAVAGCPAGRSRNSYAHACRTQPEIIQAVCQNVRRRSARLQQIDLAFSLWRRQNSNWLTRESQYEALSQKYGTDDWLKWDTADRVLSETGSQIDDRARRLLEEHAERVFDFQFAQFVVHQQHQQYKKLAGELGLKLFADLQVGISHRDRWAARHLCLDGYSLGAPPSRTNPDGQPWGYPLLNPKLYFAGDTKYGALDEEAVLGPALRWLSMRVDKLLSEFDGIRIDHPHGFVCPWVYKTDLPDALSAVQNGARLFESPDVDEHESLSLYAIARPDQINHSVVRYHDNWIAQLADEQVARYAIVIDLIQTRIRERKLDPSDIVCEILSSCPFPLQRVLQRNHLGRFRVTQKAKPDDPADIYRTDNAAEADWVMVGTHDTKPIWLAVQQWTDADCRKWANYLAGRLEPDQSLRAEFRRNLLDSKPAMVEAMFADLFVGPAKNVSVFFADLLGILDIYNRPGVVSEQNWVTSVPNDYVAVYNRRVAQQAALNLPAVLGMALRARRNELGPASAELAARLVANSMLSTSE